MCSYLHYVTCIGGARRRSNPDTRNRRNKAKESMNTDNACCNKFASMAVNGGRVSKKECHVHFLSDKSDTTGLYCRSGEQISRPTKFDATRERPLFTNKGGSFFFYMESISPTILLLSKRHLQHAIRSNCSHQFIVAQVEGWGGVGQERACSAQGDVWTMPDELCRPVVPNLGGFLLNHVIKYNKGSGEQHINREANMNDSSAGGACMSLI